MWNWLINPREPYTWGFIFRVVIKATLLFILINLLFVWLKPMTILGHISAFNTLFEGRDRLPAGPARQSFAMTVSHLPTMFSTHKIAQPKADDEFRVIILGNSGIWGFGISPSNTLSIQLNTMRYLLPDSNRLIAYNLAHPQPSIVRDLLFLDEAMSYDIDLIIWYVTLAGLQRDPLGPIVETNPDRVRNLIAEYGLNLDFNDPRLQQKNFWYESLIGQRQYLSDWFFTQLHGFMWQNTKFDSKLLGRNVTYQNDIIDLNDHGAVTLPSTITSDVLSFDVLESGYKRAGDVPLIIINQPILVATGINSEYAYNMYYPRPAYDTYRDLLGNIANDADWLYCDLWDAIPKELFTDSPLHMNVQGHGLLAQILGDIVVDYIEFGYLRQECE
jgi:hypothetical protein